MEKNEKGKNGDGFIDRSKVRILLCDNDERSSEEVLTLLCKCSYQVISVKSPRQVIDALNAEGPNIDIILSEVDLPMSKGFKMLKYITRDKELRRIPVIMMSAQDEESVVVKCLKSGAADYLVKPLRTNELLNLWTHMWRRRRMLGLAEKNIVNYDLELVLSDPSDANTNSTTLFSDDTDEKSQKSTNPEPCISKHQEYEINAVTIATPIETVGAPSRSWPDYMSATSNIQTGPISPFAKKSELKIGESSAFIMYVKSTTPKTNNLISSSIHEEPQHVTVLENLPTAPNIQGHYNSISFENHSQPDDLRSSNSVPDSYPTEPSCTRQKNSNEDFSQAPMHFQNDTPADIHGYYSHNTYPYYIPGITSHQVPMQQNHVNSTMFPQYNHIPQCPPGMASYNLYYPFGICLQPGQMPTTHQWQSFVNSSSNEQKMTKVDRREAALVKFRQKRKERCFDKKIRYANRKKLAERRPRVRGQFVRKVNGVNVDLNGQPADEDEENYDEEDQSANTDFSPEEA